MGFPLRHRQNGALKVLPKLWDGECRTMLGPVRVFPDHLLWLRSLCRTTGHFLLLVFDVFESSLTILSLVHLVFIMGSSPLDMSLKRVSAMDYNSF